MRRAIPKSGFPPFRPPLEIDTLSVRYSSYSLLSLQVPISPEFKSGPETDLYEQDHASP